MTRQRPQHSDPVIGRALLCIGVLVLLATGIANARTPQEGCKYWKLHAVTKHDQCLVRLHPNPPRCERTFVRAVQRIDARFAQRGASCEIDDDGVADLRDNGIFVANSGHPVRSARPAFWGRWRTIL